MEPMDKLRKARAGLILDAPFFGSLALRIVLKEDPTCETLWTDGRSLGFSPDFIDGLTLDETKGVIAHEVMHLANCHHTRRRGRDSKVWNKSDDYAINSILEESKVVLPPCRLRDPDFDGKSTEEIYGRLSGRPDPEGTPDPGAGQDEPADPPPPDASGDEPQEGPGDAPADGQDGDGPPDDQDGSGDGDGSEPGPGPPAKGPGRWGPRRLRRNPGPSKRRRRRPGDFIGNQPTGAGMEDRGRSGGHDGEIARDSSRWSRPDGSGDREPEARLANGPAPVHRNECQERLHLEPPE